MQRRIEDRGRKWEAAALITSGLSGAPLVVGSTAELLSLWSNNSPIIQLLSTVSFALPIIGLFVTTKLADHARKIRQETNFPQSNATNRRMGYRLFGIFMSDIALSAFGQALIAQTQHHNLLETVAYAAGSATAAFIAIAQADKARFLTELLNLPQNRE